MRVTQSGAAPSELENAGHEEGRGRGRRRQRRQAHHLDRSPKGSSVDDDRVPARDRTRTARSTTSRTRSPRSAPTCRAPSTSRSSAHRDRRPADRDLRGLERRRMTPEELSWFVDDVVARAAAEREGRRRRSSASAASTARSASRSIPTGCSRSASPPRDVNRQLRADQRRSRRRPRRGRRPASRRSARSPARRRLDDARRHARSSLPGGRKVRLDELGDRHGRARPSRAPSPRLNGEPVVAFAISRAKGASDAVGRPPVVAKKIAELRKAHPEVELRRSSTRTVDYTVGNYHSAMQTLIEGAHARGRSSCSSSCATGARR